MLNASGLLLRDDGVFRVEYTSCYFEGGRVKTPVYQLSDLGAEDVVEGPAIIIDKTSTIVVEPHCKATITKWGDISIEVTTSRKVSIGYVGERTPITTAFGADNSVSNAERSWIRSSCRSSATAS